jgi:hypothetical protein
VTIEEVIAEGQDGFYGMEFHFDLKDIGAINSRSCKMDWWSIFLYLITVSRKNSCNIFLLGLKIIKTNIIYYEWKINQALLQ